MSRSRRKPYVKDHKSCKVGKFLANRAVRRVKLDNVGNHSFYKKLYERYDIYDYKCLVRGEDEEKYKRK